MKAKILGFFCSLLIINFAYGQTIDGVLYTNFNNYYKWKGGAFDSTFLLPQTSATNGKRAGALRYAAADSSVYSWSGTQWIKLGGAAASDTATVVKAYVTNAEAVTITKGQVVYIFGASGDRAAVKLAKNTSDTFSSKTLGIVRADIAAGQAGWVTTQGQVSGINLGAYTAGDILWLDSVAGGFTKTKPVAPYHSVFIGVVERANAGNGLIYVKPQNGQELGELHDTKITSPTNNQVLAYTAATDIWENKSVATALGYTPLDSVLNIAGSGVALVKGNDQIKRLKAGSGISITDNMDSVTITNVGAVSWQSADTLYAYNKVRNGRHIMADIEYIGQSNQSAGWGDAWQFIQSASTANTNFNSDGVNGIRLTVAASANNAFVLQGQGTIRTMSFINANDPAVVNFRIRLNDLYDATDRIWMQIGLYDVAATNPANGYLFIYDKGQTMTGTAASDNWQCLTVNGSNRTYTTTSTAVVEDAFVNLSLRITTGKVIFYVNGSIVAEHTTNITTANTAIVCRLQKTAGTGTKTCDVDYITFDQWYSTLR